MAVDDITVLTNFRALLEEWEQLHEDNWHTEEKARRVSQVRNDIGVLLEHVRELVSAALPIRPLVDRRNDDEALDPFDAIFKSTWLTSDVRNLVNRAIGIY